MVFVLVEGEGIIGWFFDCNPLPFRILLGPKIVIGPFM